MPRGLDHIVLCVRDLDRAAASWRRLGFQVGAMNLHPWGTANRLVQFPGFFVELLAVADPSRFVPAKPRQVSFGDLARDFLARNGEGAAMLALESANARADAQVFRATALGDFEPFHFTREGKRPDGSAATVAFTLAFASDPSSPQTGFFVCEQHFPGNFWNPAFQAHDNGSSRVRGVVLVADNPSDHHVFLEGFVGERNIRSSSLGLTIPTPRGDIAVMEPDIFERMFRVAPPPSSNGLRIAALRVATTNRDAVQRRVGDAQPTLTGDGMVVAPASAHGLALVFEAA